MSITTLWRRKGQHHAGTLKAQLAEAKARLAAADRLTESQFLRIIELGAENTALRQAHREIAKQLNVAEAQLDTVTTAHELLAEENNELAARYTELQQENDQLRATPATAPIPLRPTYDPDATTENVMPLWDATGLPTFATAAGQAA